MKNYMLILFLLFIISIGIVKANNMELLGKIIYIDPGHGGKDPGAIYNGINESDINLEISLRLKEELEKDGAIVYLTRYEDYDLSSNNVTLRKRSDLSNRAKLINKSNADIYVSIHLNADQSPKWYGAQVFYDSINPENAKIAEIIQKHLKQDLDTNRKFKELKNQYMYKQVKVKGVLIEVGFLSNKMENIKLQSSEYQLKLAQSIRDGIIDYFKSYI